MSSVIPLQSLQLDQESGGLILQAQDGRVAPLHPLWLRERSGEADQFDAGNHQRLFEPAELPEDLRVTAAEVSGPEGIAVTFSDGHRCSFALESLERELNWCADPAEPPGPEPWTAGLPDRPTASWPALGDPTALRALLDGYFRTGFCLLTDVPREPGTLAQVARRFGYLRDTNFGPLFDVQVKDRPIDLAYTGRGLSAHADNPYRQPIPGIQLLHCLESTVAGGLSTLVDGFAVAERLSEEMPDGARMLERVPVRFTYDSEDAVMQSRGPLIERGADNRLVRVRFSTRLDYVPPLPPAELTLYYAARRRMYVLANADAMRITFRLEPGMVMMMNNERLLHGRTAFETGSGGRRHLQGGYIDHDGPDSLFRRLSREVAQPAAAAAAAAAE
jgi:gamma-butyrobetaine dioxygenase